MSEISLRLSVHGRPLAGSRKGPDAEARAQAATDCSEFVDRVMGAVEVSRVYDQSPSDCDSKVGDVDFSDGSSYIKLQSRRDRNHTADAMATVQAFFYSTVDIDFNYSRDGQKETFDERSGDSFRTVVRDNREGTITFLEAPKPGSSLHE